MEYFWYVIAAIGAGVGTGLAGLSAATVMVPILLVLCPSFAGEAGAYQATAIALASDILGSAVTTTVYIKHKNFDLRRGWIMLVCILTMCIAGSYVAYLAGNVVLGGFSLFLTFCIGIRFLVKPDSQRKDVASKGTKLDWKGVAISLFFGLTIGFGTGFVGTGGGMMMLIVFTAFLGMELKTAVGTSTFIMTFTALIASTSHILIEPSIVLERWDALVICVVVATLSSLFSARFANNVKNKTVGLVTGAVLLVLGASMILLNYWSFITSVTLLYETLICIARFAGFIVIGAIILIVIRFTTKVPDYIFRKLLHIVAFVSIVIMLMTAREWLAACISSLVFAAILFPVLWLLEKEPWYDKLFVQKGKGEIKASLILLFTMVAAMTAFAWGLMGHRYVAVAATLMWGVGDAFAAIIGIRFGKHIIPWKVSDGKKTFEGTIAMLISAFICGSVIMITASPLSWYICIALVLPAACASAFVELISKKGSDTVTVPVTATLILSLEMLIINLF